MKEKNGLGWGDPEHLAGQVERDDLFGEAGCDVQAGEKGKNCVMGSWGKERILRGSLVNYL